ncbi:MAG: flagellar protein FliT [Sulfurimicrobium sp.]|nr:flagellar protein FliT [Sulfurimicrobium sp.]MDO9190208.1 flagellar protein FliT [Sulfurimicrobium sp.]MDP1705783.1 flagellar protein FliT [Sulfurimicrobium sp.]MDP1897103.1 flagellar protein FliT [Sulfurimicrobium sp.]MDP2196965.1 flagellar protein FliT [Sulfurimicrobium sp.]
MNSAQVIANYELLSTLTVQMREAAELEKWDELISIEQQCSELVETMKPIDAAVELDEAARNYKNQLIQKILADEAMIRNHTQSWMKQLKHLMESNRQEQRLQQTYGAVD